MSPPCSARWTVEEEKADVKALVNRLPALQDLAAHGASTDQSVADQSGGGGGGGDGFKEGMEGDERECTSDSSFIFVSFDHLFTPSHFLLS
jgi:hypothetical protein